jgi:DNA-binding beta-propeller fold protein YncE
MPRRRRRRRGRATALALLAVAALPGCASQWSPREARPEVALQWPYAPAPAKLTYVRSLDGFAAAATVGATLRAIAIGRDEGRDDRFGLPVAVAAGGDGRLAVADLGRRCVHLYLPATKRYLRIDDAGGAPLRSPVAVAFAEDGTLFISDSAGRLLAFDAAGEPLWQRDQVGGVRLQRPTGLAYDAARRRLYLVDTLASRVYALDARGNLEAAFGAPGAGEGELHFPTHAFWSAARGELYVTDALNFRIAVFDGEGRPRGALGRHGDGSGDLAMPKGVAVDRDGVVYVADALFDNVQLFDREGGLLLTLGRRGGELGELWLPAGVFIDDGGLLYVCDSYNRRVQVFRLSEGYAAAG